MPQLSDWMPECSRITYFKKLQLQDEQTIKLNSPQIVKFSSLDSHSLNIRSWLKVLEANHNYVDDVLPALNKCSVFPGDLREHFWSKELNCTIVESFQHAFVLLPVGTSAVRHSMLEHAWVPMSPGSKYTTAPPSLSRVAASFTSRTSSDQRTLTSRNTRSLSTHHIRPLSGKKTCWVTRRWWVKCQCWILEIRRGPDTTF